VDFEDMELEALFRRADAIGQRRYNRLTSADLEDYKKFEQWRYINGDSECGSTPESQNWVRQNSDWHCPICEERFSKFNGRTIDHKLPRSRYPWLSMDFRNFWVICKACNVEKGEMHWFEYEHYMFIKHPELLPAIQSVRPIALLKSLKER
jgi:rubredoxin